MDTELTIVVVDVQRQIKPLPAIKGPGLSKLKNQTYRLWGLSIWGALLLSVLVP